MLEQFSPHMHVQRTHLLSAILPVISTWDRCAESLPWKLLIQILLCTPWWNINKDMRGLKIFILQTFYLHFFH